MNKRLIVLFGIIFISLTLFGINYLLSLHKVSFDLDEEVSSITIYTDDEKKIKHFETDSHLLLQEGEYYILPEGDKIADDRITFTVKGQDTTVEVRPSYSKEHLSTLFDQERPVVQETLKEKYSSLIVDYTLSQGKLYGRGDWFGGLLEPNATERDRKAPYRVVLHKEKGGWVVVRRPEYVLTSSRYQGVPVEILRDINLLVGEPGSS